VSPQPNDLLDLFRSTGAYLNGHFRLTSGRHSGEYMQCALVLQHPGHAERLGRMLAEALDANVDAIASPALGGVIIGHEVARALGVRFVFTERGPEGKMTLRRGFNVSPGEKFAVIEDVVTTGGSTREVVEVLRAAGAEPVLAGSIVDRSGGAADVGVPRVSLLTMVVESWPAEECPHCRAGMPVSKPGSRPA
jgi:orotate phosphoribosyltransferase